MTSQAEKPVIAFVWRPREITSSVVEMARQTKTQAIFDLSSIDPVTAGPALLQADASAGAVDLKISPSALMEPCLEDLLEECDFSRVWVELHPMLLDADADRYLDRIASLHDRVTVVPVIGSVDLLSRIVARGTQIANVGLKGSEAAGFVSSETIFALYAAAREMIAPGPDAPKLMIWGGLATPEAVAAFLCTGAAGVVFESLHWLTDLVAVEEPVRARVKGLRPNQTDLTGLNLGVPCRLFNKGNSVAVKQLKSYAGSLCGVEIQDEQRRFFADRIREGSVTALESSFGRDELVPLGIEAAFADSFVRRFGPSTERAVERFVTAIELCCGTAASKITAFTESSMAREMGTRYPFIQGAMSWITDVPEFALAVAEAGGLPTVALGLMNGDVLENKLGRLPEIMGDRPYAVNAITLAENPYRDEQLAWIRKIKPRFAVIAAGEPSHAAHLIAEGIDVMYIAPNEDLVKLAFEAGVRTVICEGNEAGGHVGEHSTLTLAQILLDLKDLDPRLFEGRRVVLAGGIFNRETALMAAMLGVDAVQMGTVYLSTTEIVETGALTGLYQRMILDSRPGDTTVTGEGTGLRVRSLKTPKIEAVCSLERDFAAGSEDEASFRQKIEALSAGSLFVAARGLDKPGGSPLDECACIAQGQFMSGACAGAVTSVRRLADLHEELAQGALAEGLPLLGPIREAPAPRPAVEDVGGRIPFVGRERAASVIKKERCAERIAITGMAAVNSLGNSPEEIWAASLAMKSGIIAVPPSRWDHEVFYHPRPRMSEKTYCKVAAFQNVEVSRKELGIPPQDFRTMTSSTKLTMWLAKQAVEQSGILDSDIPRERVAVLISQNSGEAAATLEDVIIRGCAGTIASSVGRALQLSPEAQRVVEEEVKSGRIVIDDTTLLGRLNCSAGGFICNKYGFMGPSFSVSAACATALVALYSAYQMIRNGVIDAAVVGGAEELLTPMHFLEFSALGALAGLSGVDRSPHQFSRPFDADRDGMVLGEGGGMIVIERESSARERGARVHAFITSMGASNNHLGMVESSRATQEIAIRASFRDASYGPEAVDLVECHATSTRQGDVEEVRALSSLFGSDGTTVLTSFKSQIGHTLGASGVNSLIRGIMAMSAGAFPGNLNYDTPDPEIEAGASGLEIRREPSEWNRRNGRPRRLQVNAFGFGGSNYVVQVEQALEEDFVLVDTGAQPHPPEISSSVPDLPDGVFFFNAQTDSHAWRVAVLAESEEQARQAIEKSEALSNGGPVPVKRMRALVRQGIHLGPEEAEKPGLAFVFPGQGSHYAGMGHELYQTFPVIREWMDRAAQVADFDLLRLLFFDREEDLQKTRWQQPALFTIEYAMVQYLWCLGVRPVAMAGHSLGELTALCLSGVYSFEDGFRIVNKRAICMDKACTLNVDPGIMVATDAPLEVVEDMVSARDNVYITNINSLRQVVIGGGTEVVKTFAAELKEMGHRSTQLRVSMAFHSPIMECIHDELEEFIAGIEFHAPQIPVISNTTMQPFPSDADEIRRTVMAHLESPVHWLQNARTLIEDFGVKVFVEVGPREILSNLIADSFENADCIQTCLPSAEVTMLKTALAQLFARGHLHPRRVSGFVSSTASSKSAGEAPAAAPRQQVSSIRGSVAPSPLEHIVQREINSFVLESFGRFLRPSILAAIRREHDPSFAEENLDAVLGKLFPRVSKQIALPKAPILEHVAVTQGADIVPMGEVTTAKPEPPAAGPVEQDVAEEVIRIIMDATGYDRDEIEPEMDLREDLSIRSSRLPVIMDSLESHFKIKIELEDFMDVRTIRDIAERISEVLARKGAGVALPPALLETGPKEIPAEESSARPAEPIKRIVFREAPLENGSMQPLELSPLGQVVVAAADGGTDLPKEIGGIIRRDYGATIIPISVLDGADEEWIVDLRTANLAAQAGDKLWELQSLAGMIVLVDDLMERKLEHKEDVSAVLTGMFGLLKAFAASPAKKFFLVIQKTTEDQGVGRILSEGALGMLLTAVHELGSVLFRWLYVDESASLSDAIRSALDRRYKPVQIFARDGAVTTCQGQVNPAIYEAGGCLELGPGDVVVFSGGAYGITPSLARGLAPLGCTMVFLGRTRIDPEVDFKALLAEQGTPQETAEKLISTSMPHLAGIERERERSRIVAALEITRTLEDLRECGIAASYMSCDVTDPVRARQVSEEIAARHGKIDGVIHAAGVLKDSFIKNMTLEDFRAVLEVKLLGAWNLFDAVKDRGVRFFTCLSSAASIQGNPGQVNYSAGNRAMSALVSALRSQAPSVRCKALILPPIEGAGMAEDPDVKALMARMNARYVHTQELAALFARELIVAPEDDVWVMFMRSLPDLPSAPIDTGDPAPVSGKIRAAEVLFPQQDFPMIDTVSRVDLLRGDLEAKRAFAHEKDLWINDHMPFGFLKHPLVSAIMALETFLEASRILYPYLEPIAVMDAKFLDIVACPPDAARQAHIKCTRVVSKVSETVCEVTLKTREISPTGRLMDRMNTNYRALIVLGTPHVLDQGPGDFPIVPEKLETRPMDNSEVLRKYAEKTSMRGRYRVIDSLDGTSEGLIRGHFVYRDSDDFSGSLRTSYQYCPYLLEALIQLVNFYILMRDSNEDRTLIPYAIGEVRFSRKCLDGERVKIEGHMRKQDQEGITWCSRAVDRSGAVIMAVKDLKMRWFAK